MPSADELVTMVAHVYGTTPGRYLTTRTRQEFTADASAAMKSKLMGISVVTSLVNKALGGEPDTGEKLQAPPGPEKPMTRDDVTKMRRERTSSVMYPWLRKISGRNYKVFNLDTRNPDDFKRATQQLGKSLARRVQ